jgi:hypothetical protein
MKRYIIILLTVLISFSACSPSGDDNITSFIPVIIPVESAEVPLEFTLGESYPITVRYAFPNGCYTFNDIHYETNGYTRIIAIRAIVNNNKACTQSIVEGEHTFTLKCTQTETYILKFWKGKDTQGQDQYLIVEVPVNS